MRKISYLGVFVLCLVIAPLYGMAAKKVALTPPWMVSMIFSRLAGETPDFEFLARSTPTYQAAEPADKQVELGQQVGILRDAYNSLDLQQPITLRTPVKLSKYNAAKQGFYIENFNTETFFPVHDAEKSYAIVPNGIKEQQFIKVSEKAVSDKIEAAANSNKYHVLSMVLSLVPESADKSAPVSLGEKEYWLISAHIQKMMLYSVRGNNLLWQSGSDEKKHDLMKLYQGSD